MGKYEHALALYPYRWNSTPYMGVFPPTGLEYIAASIKALVPRVTLLDLRHERACRDPATLSELVRSQVDILCVSVPWDAQFDDVCECIGRLPAEVFTVVGGNKAAREVELLLGRYPNVDLVVRGEGEEAIRQIVSGDPRSSIPGVSYRADGGIVHNPILPVRDISRLPYPDRSLRRHDYHFVLDGVPLSRLTFDTVLTTRGCPRRCKFCTFSLGPAGHRRRYAERPLHSVMAELKTITADVVVFADDNFFANPARSERLLEQIAEDGLDKTFVAQARIEVAHHTRLLDKATKAGLKVLLLGIESPHDSVLEQLGKGFSQQEIRQALAVLGRYDFFLHGYFIYGNVGETAEQMLYISQFAREIGVDSISFQKLRIDEHSPLREVVQNTPGYHYTHLGGAVYSDRYGLDDLKRIRNRIFRDFYTPRQIAHVVHEVRRLGLIDSRDLLRMSARLPTLLHWVLRRLRQDAASEAARAQMKARAARRAPGATGAGRPGDGSGEHRSLHASRANGSAAVDDASCDADCGSTDKPTVAVVIAGGLAHSSFGEQARTPKPLLPVHGRPVVDYVVQALEHSGAERILVSYDEEVDLPSVLTPTTRTFFAARGDHGGSYAAGIRHVFEVLATHYDIHEIHQRTIMLVPCDLPLVTAAAFDALIRSAQAVDADLVATMISCRRASARFPGKRFIGLYLADFGEPCTLQAPAFVQGDIIRAGIHGSPLSFGELTNQVVDELAGAADSIRSSRKSRLVLARATYELVIRRLARQRQLGLLLPFLSRLVSGRVRSADVLRVLSAAFAIRVGIVPSEAPEFSGDVDEPGDYPQVLGVPWTPHDAAHDADASGAWPIECGASGLRRTPSTGGGRRPAPRAALAGTTIRRRRG